MRNRGWPRRIVLVTLLAASAATALWFDARRPDNGTAEHSLIVVTSSLDSGAGSLREAIFTALRAKHPPRIQLRVARIVLQEPLPPASHAASFAIESDLGTVLDASALSAEAALEVHAPAVHLRHIAITHAAQIALLVRAGSAVIDQVSVNDADVGVMLSAGLTNFEIRNSDFNGNRVAIQTAAVTEGTIAHNRFVANTGTAVRLVATEEEGTHQRVVRISRNRFERDNDAIVIANQPAAIDGNTIVNAAHDAVSILSGSAAIRGNIIRGAQHVGILIDGEVRVEVVENEIGRSAGTGILLRAALEARIARNRIFGNENGIVQMAGSNLRPPLLIDNVVFEQRGDGIVVVGGSPLLRGNRALHNRGAGLRLEGGTAPDGTRSAASPLLDANILLGNASDQVVGGQAP